MPDVEQEIEALQYARDEIRDKTRAIYEATLRESRYLLTGNFTAIAAEDVERLFRLYDEAFFAGLFRGLLERDGEGKLTFHVSSRMTSAGGKTTQVRRRERSGSGAGPVIGYELSVSATLLFQTFREETRPIVVTGIACADRLEALQRIVEHEMIHLLELLVWQDSSCARERFRRLANNLFGHTAVRHALVTQREIAHQDFGIKVGDAVAFHHEGVRRTGVVNRITKRVTVLVEDAKGAPYSNGKRYLKFYVPLPLLERVEPAQPVAGSGAPSGIRLDAAGVAWIDGTRTKVMEVARRKQASGASPEALQRAMPHLPLAQIYAALAYYHAHQQTMDAEIARQRRAEAPRAPEPASPAREERSKRKKAPRGKHRRR